MMLYLNSLLKDTFTFKKYEYIFKHRQHLVNVSHTQLTFYNIINTDVTQWKPLQDWLGFFYFL